MAARLIVIGQGGCGTSAVSCAAVFSNALVIGVGVAIGFGALGGTGVARVTGAAVLIGAGVCGADSGNVLITSSFWPYTTCLHACLQVILYAWFLFTSLAATAFSLAARPGDVMKAETESITADQSVAMNAATPQNREDPTKKCVHESRQESTGTAENTAGYGSSQ